MQHGERQLAGKECLACQMQHHGGVFTNGVEHHRVVEFGGHFTNDVDTFRLQLFQVGQFIEHGYSQISFGLRLAGREREREDSSTAQSSKWTTA